MKQFYEMYSSDDFVSPIATQLEAFFSGIESSPDMSALPSKSKGKKVGKVSAVPTQLEKTKEKLVTSLLCRVTWTNHLEILSKTKSAEEKFFYLFQCIKEKWSMRDLRRQLNSAYFERTMLSTQKASGLQTQLPQNLFKDPYIFEFLDLPDGHSEKDLEKALILNLQKFILEIGKGFAYMGNQYRLQVGNKDYYTDLLFYHRDLQCLVLFELKIQEFEPEFLGKLNFYLEALDRDVKRPFENNSVGILLCKGKDTEVVEYAMARNTSPAMIADYETQLIPKKILAKKLHQLVEQLSKEDID
jgi:predicted nuclease of restriction endonuclease-like (RecB) superfamily